MVSSSSFHQFVFISQKKDYGDGFYFFLSFVLIIFFCSSLSFFSLQASTNAYKDMHLRFAIHLSIFVVDIFFFLVSQANWYFCFCFFQRSNGFFG